MWYGDKSAGAVTNVLVVHIDGEVGDVEAPDSVQVIVTFAGALKLVSIRVGPSVLIHVFKLLLNCFFVFLDYLIS